MLKKTVWFASAIVGVLIVMYNYVGREPEPPIVNEPKIIAHRGANDRFNESTITAYEIAANDGADSLEIDLRMTEDQTLVAMHDENIDRTTNGLGEVSDYSLEELKEFQTVEVFGNERATERVPTLREIIETFTDSQHYYIETRLEDGELVMEEALIGLLNEYDLIAKELVTIQSFSQQSLEKVHELAPDIPLTLLYSKGNFDLSEAKSVDYPIIGIESSDVNMKNVNALHRQGKEVHVYFNDEATQKEEQERVKALHVDGFFTDDIEYTKELLDRK
ncbi:glycerophosphodiester phosphodiesterase [Virgibacillus sp. NKC19-16]|uniref:glycerophosphodiester phosphodiesterase n=1 Tax=Virgibacillus salidurans TaxID=2831673 RepID=UPI001F3A354E|nr:glycerophosphodiester phosphodiesterase family protein [Virgibacillus sp. NKC19-16]UJL46049.1 glycerophosphodiester phosphodiesterase [Virgibacillus sp. NKC19-16]